MSVRRQRLSTQSNLTTRACASLQTVEILADVWELDLSVGFSSDSRGVWRRIGDLPFPVAYGAAMYHSASESIFIQGGLIIEEGDEGVRLGSANTPSTNASMRHL